MPRLYTTLAFVLVHAIISKQTISIVHVVLLARLWLAVGRGSFFFVGSVTGKGQRSQFQTVVFGLIGQVSVTLSIE